MRAKIARGSLFLTWVSILFITTLTAQDEDSSRALVEVRSSPSFNLVAPARLSRDRWLEVEIPLTVRNVAGQTHVDNIRVVLKMATEGGAPTRGERRFYRSEVELATLSRGNHPIRFYLPGAIVDRDRLSGEPFAWAVRVFVDGSEQPLRSHHSRGQNVRSDSVYQSFLQAVSTGARANEGVLVPIHDSPFFNNFPSEPALPYVRRPVRSG